MYGRQQNFQDLSYHWDADLATSILPYGTFAARPAARRELLGFVYFAGDTGQAYQCQMVAAAPAWLQVATGGFTNPMTTLGDLIYGGASGVGTRLVGDTSNVRKFLRELSVAGAATAPIWDTLLAGDIPSLDTSKITTGQLALARGGSGADLSATGGANQVVRQNSAGGAFTVSALAVGDLPNLAGLTAADVALADAVIANKAGTNNTETVARLGGFFHPGTLDARLSFDSADPIHTADQTAQGTVYLVPYSGDRITTFDGTRWQIYALASLGSGYLPLGLTQSLPASSVTSGNTTVTLTGGATTAQLSRGMAVFVTGQAYSGTIASITDSTHFVLSTSVGLATNANVTVVCTIPVSSLVYLYLVDASGSPRIQFGAIGGETLGTQNGVKANNALIGSTDSNAIAAKQGVFLGAVYTNGSGSSEDSKANRLLCNLRNTVPKNCESTDSTDRSTTSTTLVQVGAVTINFVTLGSATIRTEGHCGGYMAGGVGNGLITIGSGITTEVSGTGTPVRGLIASSNADPSTFTTLAEVPAAGLVTRYLLFRADTNAHTAHADGGGDGLGGPSTVLRAMVQV